MPPRLQLEHITKTYPGVVANDDISLAVQPGEIHAVLGENGAGKSTLMKIIYGAVQPDAGHMLIDGAPAVFASPREARARGIAMVFQHFKLFHSMTVAENVWLGLDQALPLAQVRQLIREKAERYGLPIDPDRSLHTLGVGEQQRVEIIRALLTNPRLLILDEPTSVLTPQAVQGLFGMLRQLSAEGCSMLYISHKLHEIQSLCQVCTVLRHGRVVGTCDPRQETAAALSRMMMGAEPPAPAPRGQRVPGPELLATQALSLPPRHAFGVELQEVSLSVRGGEILGIAGVSGNGQAELMAALSGEDARARPEAIRLAGQTVGRWGPARRRAAGLHYVPEQRLGHGAVPELDLARNLLLTRTESAPHGWIRERRLREQARGIVRRFGVRTPDVSTPARALSGGNLQKYIVGREIDAGPRVLLLAQPTWGVDVGAQAQIHADILALRDAGCAVLVVSEELDELFALCDALVVMARGRLSPRVPVSEASVAQIGAWMGGQWPHDFAAPAQGATEPADAAALEAGA